jgi:hypothetical protein
MNTEKAVMSTMERGLNITSKIGKEEAEERERV